MAERPKRQVIDVSGNSEFEERDGQWHGYFPPLDVHAQGSTQEEAQKSLFAALGDAINASEEAAAMWQEFAESHIIEREYTEEEIREEEDMKRRSKEAAASFKILDQTTLDEAIKSSTPLLVDFWAEWCMPCHMMAPELKAAADELGDRISVAKLNVDDYKEAWQRFSIEGIPTVILFREGKEIHRLLGAQSKDSIVEELLPRL